MGEGGRKPPRRGRCEAALEQDLLERRDLGKAERTALRAQARAVDLAEAMSDPELVTKANVGYLSLRQAAGLTSGGTRPVDVFDELLAQLAAPGAGDTADT